MKYAKKVGYIAALILFLIFTAGPFVWTFYHIHYAGPCHVCSDTGAFAGRGDI